MSMYLQPWNTSHRWLNRGGQVSKLQLFHISHFGIFHEKQLAKVLMLVFVIASCHGIYIACSNLSIQSGKVYCNFFCQVVTMKTHVFGFAVVLLPNALQGRKHILSQYICELAERMFQKNVKNCLFQGCLQLVQGLLLN